MTKKNKKMLKRILAALILYAALLVLIRLNVPGLSVSEPLQFVCFLVPYLLAGYDVLWTAFRNIANGQIFDENFLMMLATFGAFGIREYPEAVAVMVFYQVGELFQSIAVGKSRASITAMMDIVPEYANLLADGVITQTDPDDIEVGSLIVIKPGERVPLDGVVTEGSSYLDTSALTGESVPRRVSVHDAVYSGCINTEGTLTVRTTKEYDDSTVAKILEMVENAAEKKARTEKFITRFARWYTPVVTIGAACVAFVPPLFAGNLAEWIGRACIFLVISCPCALVISVPLGFFGGIGAASKMGVLIKGSNYLETMANADVLVFDKTGTLTRGEFAVAELVPASVSKEELLKLAALAENFSNHPIAHSIRTAYGKEADLSWFEDAEEFPGRGVSVFVNGSRIMAGNARLMEDHKITYTPCKSTGTVVYVAKDDVFAGAVVIADRIKDGAKEALDALRRAGVRKTVMLTGDHKEAADAVAEQLGIDQVYAGLLPDQKVACMEQILSGKAAHTAVAYAGDGINDAPVLTRADVGIAMGSMGQDAAIEAADIVLMDDDLAKIAKVIPLAGKTMRIVRENIIFALCVKFLVLVLGVLGIANMWEAVFADVGVAVIAILNAMRTLRVKTYRR